MSKVEKAIIVLFVVILALFTVPAILPLISGDAAWIMLPVLLIFAVLFPLLVILKKD